MKKTILWIVALLMLGSIFGCGGTDGKAPSKQDGKVEQSMLETAAFAPTAEPTTAPTIEPTAIPTIEPTAVPTPEPTAVPVMTLPQSGYAIDENGFCITTGELFDGLKALLTDNGSEFYSGVDVMIVNGDTTKEIRSVLFDGVNTAYMVSTIMEGKDDFPQDNEPFTLITVIGDLSTDLNRLGMTTVVTAIFHMTYPDANGFQEASDLFLELIQNEGKWVQKGKMEYMYSNLTGTIYAVAIREIAAYR